jgi:hypothetical protein
LDNLDFILNCLVEEQPEQRQLNFSPDLKGKRQILRSLMNLRPPVPASGQFLKAQDEELQKQLHEKGVAGLNQTRSSPIDNRIKLWQGDITRLEVDAIVNAVFWCVHCLNHSLLPFV